MDNEGIPSAVRPQQLRCQLSIIRCPLTIAVLSCGFYYSYRMYLHRIELHGFKSFADRTQVQFDPGVTAIVGPNGCGKSNIIDAVRWVLGEQRARLLRSDKMESVIFNGTSKRRQLGMAEVSLTIHNTRGVLPTEYTEVTVARRLYRSGESEYILNGTVCRLKDIMDLFMDTGIGAGAYSVIELKMIEDLLSESPQDRRRLFEEAAGITRYKLRRAQALRKLDQTQTDLNRLRDLTEEIGRNVRSLERQASRAEKYKDISGRLKDLELNVAAAEHERLATSARQARADASRLEEQLAERTAQLQSREAEIEHRRLSLIDLEKALADAARLAQEHTTKIQQAETEARLSAGKRDAAQEALARLIREADADEERQKTALQDSEKLAGTIETAMIAAEQTATQEKERTDELAEATDAAQQARQALANLDQQLSTLNNQLREAERSLDARRNRHKLLQEEQVRLDVQKGQIAALVAEAQNALQEAEKHEEEARTAHQQAEALLMERESEKKNLDEQLEIVRSTLADARRIRDAAQVEAELIESLLESYEGFSDAVQSLLAKPDWAEKPQTVADLLICEPEYRRAVDAALGPFADCLVVQTEQDAKNGIARLRRDETGRATFLVLDRLSKHGPLEISPTPPDSIPLDKHVSTKKTEHQRLIRALLSNHFLVDSLDEAQSLAEKYPVARLVTREGEWMAGGAVRAGAEEKSASADRIGRQEQLESASKNQQGAEARIAEIEKELHEIHSKRDALALEEVRNALRDSERKLAEAGRLAAEARAKAHSEAQRSTELTERVTQLHSQIGEAEQSTVADESLEDLKRQLTEVSGNRETARLAAEQAEAQSREVLDRHSEARIAAATAKNHLDGLVRERERAIQTLAEINNRAHRRDEEKLELEAARTENDRQETHFKEETEILKDALIYFQEKLTTAETTVLEAKAGISDLEALAREIRKLHDETRDQLQLTQLARTETQTRLETLSERLWEDFEVVLTELDDPPEDFDVESAKEEIPRLKNQIRNLGAVNELALESYQEEKERLDFLTTQRDDLEQAEMSLRDTIKEINTTARERFEETFEEVRKAFQQLFVTLFGENAAADISLEGNDPLEDDILIVARPKGKKPSAITQLSGGEKTLTAIALLFAIYLVKPSPFCILDEVDAPLDDSNIERFMKLIRTFSESTQFILVTHNKLTMEAADRMYGVTMQEQGVSRLVGVRFSDVVSEAA